jgi:hypothetical protein
MRWAVTPMITLLLAGCGMVSGLDALGVCDACADAAGDAKPDVTAPSDAAQGDVAADAPLLDTSAPDVYDAGVGPSCFSATCAVGEVCCISTQGAASCATQPCPPNTNKVDCSLPSDCPGSYCCLQAPLNIVTGSSCQGQTCPDILCTPPNVIGPDAGCPNTYQCVSGAVPLPNGFGICF